MNLSKYIEKGISYKDYWKLWEKLTVDGKSTAKEQTEELSSFSKLNLQRSRRIHKKFELHPEVRNWISEIKEPVYWLAITETWCGDAAQNLPIFAELSKLNDNIKFRLVMRDENDDLMDHYLTNGARSIPKVIFMNKHFEVIGSWGPRPAEAQKMVMDFKKNPWTEKQKFYQEVQTWYNKDLGQSLQKEILEIISEKLEA